MFEKKVTRRGLLPCSLQKEKRTKEQIVQKRDIHNFAQNLCKKDKFAQIPCMQIPYPRACKSTTGTL